MLRDRDPFPGLENQALGPGEGKGVILFGNFGIYYGFRPVHLFKDQVS
jgi:hypothetical protein